jgi:hypothetical protein
VNKAAVDGERGFDQGAVDPEHEVRVGG